MCSTGVRWRHAAEHGGGPSPARDTHAAAASDLQLNPVLDECMTTLLDHTDLEVGIAKTQGLKENIFMTVVCTFARIPLTVREGP